MDGDEFFVCWDERLLPPRRAPPAAYEPADGHSQPFDGALQHLRYSGFKPRPVYLICLRVYVLYTDADLKGAGYINRASWAGPSETELSPLGSRAPH